MASALTAKWQVLVTYRVKRGVELSTADFYEGAKRHAVRVVMQRIRRVHPRATLLGSEITEAVDG